MAKEMLIFLLNHSCIRRPWVSGLFCLCKKQGFFVNHLPSYIYFFSFCSSGVITGEKTQTERFARTLVTNIYGLPGGLLGTEEP